MGVGFKIGLGGNHPPFLKLKASLRGAFFALRKARSTLARRPLHSMGPVFPDKGGVGSAGSWQMGLLGTQGLWRDGAQSTAGLAG